MNRKEFSQTLLKGALSFSLMETLIINDLLSKKIKSITDHWAIQMNDMCLDLRKNSISQKEWQQQIEGLLSKVNLEELMTFIDFDRLAKGFEFPDLGVNTKVVRFPKLEGLPSRLAFYRKIFGVKKGRAIIPHGHKNMTSAHLVLQGSFALKHYDKLEDQGSHLIITPTIDREIGVGDYSSISDERDNIHWFRTTSETAFTFDMIVLDLNEAAYDIDNIDLLAGEKLPDNRLRVKKMEVMDALNKYGKEHH